MTNDQFTPTTPTRLNSTQLNYSARLANNAWSEHSSVTSQC